MNHVPVSLSALCVAVFALTYAYGLGRAQEAQLAIDAFDRASYATELLNQYVPLAERAVEICTSENEHLVAEIEWRTVTP